MAELMQPVLGDSQAPMGANAAAPQKKKRDWRPGKLCAVRHTIMRKAHAFHKRTGARVFVAIQFKKRFYAYTSEPKPSPKAILKEQQRKPCRKCERREREGEFPPPLKYIRNTIRRDIWHAQDLEGLPPHRQFIKPIKRPTQPTQPTPVAAPQHGADVPHGQPLQAGHSVHVNLSEPHLLPSQHARPMAQGQALYTGHGIHPTPYEPHIHPEQHALPMAQGQALHTGHDIHPTPSEPHVHPDQHSHVMVQGQTLGTGHNIRPAPPEPYCSYHQRVSTTPYEHFPPAGQPVYSTSPEPPQPTYPDPTFQPGNDPLLEAPRQVFQPEECLQPVHPMVQEPKVVQENPAHTAEQSSESSGSSESSESSDESESGTDDDDMSLDNSDALSDSSRDEAEDGSPFQNVMSASQKAGTLASPIDLCRIDDSDDSDLTSSGSDQSAEIASLHHLPHAKSRSRVTMPDSDVDSMDIDSSSPGPSTPFARRPDPQPRRRPRGSTNKPGLFPSPPVTPPGISRRARHPGFKRLQRGIRDDIKSARASGSRRSVSSARHEPRPPSKSARITRSRAALHRRSESPEDIVIVDEGPQTRTLAGGDTTGNEMDISPSTPEAATARKDSSAPRAQRPASQGLPANLRRVEFYIPIKTVKTGRASLVGKQH